jgi:glutathione S-transferase
VVVLWHVPVSHFSEKARWALDHQQVPHRRVPLLAGSHPAVALALTRGRSSTVPVLTAGTRVIADSTAILRELGVPGSDAAWALEDLLDREVGPPVRLLVYHELLADADGRRAVVGVQAPFLPGPLRGLAGVPLAAGVDQRFGFRDDARARRAEARLEAALDRLDAALGDPPYLDGDAFSVADLTAASLLYPLALPPEGPWVPPRPPALALAHADRPIVRHARRMWAEHR